MFAHRSCVIPFTIFPYSEGASFGDDIDVKMNYFKHIKLLFNVY